MDNHISHISLSPRNFPAVSHYPFSLPVFSREQIIHFRKPVTFFAGENGSGKSTLLEATARAAGIHIWQREDSSRYRPNPFEKLLYKHVSVHWTGSQVPGAYFGSEIFNDFRRTLDNWAAADPRQLEHFGGESLVTKSHGQSIMSYCRSRYKKTGVYFLDEPETALSPKSQLELLELLTEYSAAGNAQFIIATHSPILLSFKDSVIYHFGSDLILPVEYRDTDHYRIYKRFLSDV